MNDEAGENYDEEDVKEALARTTDDGPGFEDESDLPEGDFEGFAEDDVEVEAEDVPE